MTKYNVRPLVARQLEFTTGTLFGGTWCKYTIDVTLHQCYIEVIWKVRPSRYNPDLDGRKEIFNTLQEYLDWFANLKKTYKKRITRKQWYMLHIMKLCVHLNIHHMRTGLQDVQRRN